MRVEIVGGIASGKTSLCSMYVDTRVSAVFEDFRSNPFWSLFYADPTKYAFETETTFLLQHFSQYRDGMKQAEAVICDSSILLDLAYADINLTGSKLEAFCRIYDEVVSTIGLPDVIVHLVCSAEEELRRIIARARSEETGVQIEYLESLNQAVSARVKEYAKQIKVIEINSDEVDFVSDERSIYKIRKLVLGLAEQEH